MLAISNKYASELLGLRNSEDDHKKNLLVSIYLILLRGLSF